MINDVKIFILFHQTHEESLCGNNIQEKYKDNTMQLEIIKLSFLKPYILP